MFITRSLLVDLFNFKYSFNQILSRIAKSDFQIKTDTKQPLIFVAFFSRNVNIDLCDEFEIHEGTIIIKKNQEIIHIFNKLFYSCFFGYLSEYRHN